MNEIIIKNGDIYEYEPWGGDCTALWISGELYIAKNTTKLNNKEVFHTIKHNSTKLLILNDIPNITILWENEIELKVNIPNENIIRVWYNNEIFYDFKRKTPLHNRFISVINNNDIFNYTPWGGYCTVKWIDNELLMARDVNNITNQFVWQTTNGDGKRLLNQGTVDLLWENNKRVVAFMPDPDTIRVWHDNVTYDFTRVTPVVPVAKPIEIEYEIFEENKKKESNTPEVSLTFASSTCETTPVPPYLTLEMAKLICSIAQLRAVELGVTIVVSIYDNHGNLKLFERMDNTTFGSIRMSQLKGLSSASFPVSTKALCEKSSKLPGNPFATIPDMILIPGGLPIILRNTHIGSIGVSGARPDIDEQCAQAGINGLYNHYNNPSI